jgi:hypothetical protein
MGDIASISKDLAFETKNQGHQLETLEMEIVKADEYTEKGVQ